MKNTTDVNNLTKRAKQEDAEAQFHLGLMYAYGHDVPQDYTEAMKWYLRAAEQGNVGAQNNLGVMYDEGQGVTQNYTEAIDWYRKAADQGNSGAQYNLAGMYERGDGVPQDYVEAYMWLNLAAHLDESSIAKRDKVQKMMTPEQIVEGQKMLVVRYGG